jgi:hypothetical protein
MCDACELAEAIAPVARFWRPPTQREVDGGIYELADALDKAEVDIAAKASGVVHDMVRALVVDTVRAVREGDAAAVARVTAPSSAHIAANIRQGMQDALDAGRKQVIDQRKATRMAGLPPRKSRKLAKDYLTAKAEVEAQRITDAATNAAKARAIGQVARDAEDAATIEEAAQTAAETSLAKAAMNAARESMAVGRLFAIQDLASEIETIVYTAILDNSVCDVCEAKDGEEYGPDEAGQAPNDECLGGLGDNECRCAEVVVFKRS